MSNGPISPNQPRLRLRVSDEDGRPRVVLVGPDGIEHDVGSDASVVSAQITGAGSEVFLQLKAGLDQWSFGVDTVHVDNHKLGPDDYEDLKQFWLYPGDYSGAMYDHVWTWLVDRGLAAPKN